MREDPETLAERAIIVHATKQFEERLIRAMKKRGMKPHDYRAAQ